MAEGTKVRVVRCPKCEKLLPELPDVPVYRCGGCDATLQGGKHVLAIADVLSEKSDEERGRDCENSKDSSETTGIVFKEASEADRERGGVELRRGERVLPERMVTSSSSSSSGSETVVLSNDSNGGQGSEIKAAQYDQQSIGNRSVYGGKYRRSSKAPVENWSVLDSNSDEVVKENIDENRETTPMENGPNCVGKHRGSSGAPVENWASLNSNSDVSINKNVVKNGEMNSHIENSSDSHNFQQMSNWQTTGREGTSRPFWRTPRAVVEGVRFSPCPDEGPSNCHLDSASGHGKQMQNQGMDMSGRVKYLEHDRAELLRMLDELRDQLSGSCDVSENPKERVSTTSRMVPPNSYDVHGTWLPESSSAPVRASSQLYPPDIHTQRASYPPYLNNEPVQLKNRYDVDMRNRYPAMHAPNEIPSYRDPHVSQMGRRTPHQPCQYPQRPSNGYLSGHYTEVDPDPFVPYPHNAFYDQPSCPCLRCHNKHWQVPAQVPPTSFANQRLPNVAAGHMLYQQDVPGTFAPGGYGHRGADILLHSHEPQPPLRRPSNFEPDIGVLRRVQPDRTVPAKANVVSCQPIAGGAPFIICYKCFQLLQLPADVLSTDKNQHKLRCGACSQVISFTLDGKSFIFSVPTKMEHLESKVNSDSGDVREGLHSNGHTNEQILDTYSYDCDGFTYDNQSRGANFPISNHVATGKEHLPNLNDLEKMEGLSSSLCSTEDEDSPDSIGNKRNRSNSMDLHLNANVASPVHGSPRHEHYGDSPTNQLGNKFGNGNWSKCSDQEKVVSTKRTSGQISVKDASVATEMEFSFNEDSSSGMSPDSGEVTKEENRRKNSKRSDSFFAGFIKKSFRDFVRSNQQSEGVEPNVSINGQPIAIHLIKRAEKQAGPIHPGQYWYDYRAGFWGVMGNQCLGIIPPSIEEFNYPMPKNCAGGNTGIFVNGRELHQKDLELLGGRGLPTTRDKSYVIDISGRVVDGASSEELDGLGKLAPTVQKVKHGFGMWVPRALK